MSAPLELDAPVPAGHYDPKQKYETVTRILHGVEGEAKPLDIPPNAEFSQYADNFTDDEKNAFVAQGSIAPLSDVNADISDQNDALRAENEALEAEKADMAAQLEALQAQLAAAKSAPPATPAK